jgi:FkbM family methyltransferase
LLVTSQVERRTRLWSCRKEPETVEWLRNVLVPGSVLYDIGANVGAYSLIAARLLEGTGGLVYAFEPGYRSYANLVDNVLLNGLSSTIFPLPLAANDSTALATFEYSDMSAGSANHKGLAGGVQNAAAVQTLLGCSLDDAVRIFSLRAPTAMKIDVDGAEAAVISGARMLLYGGRLTDVLVETDLGSSEAGQIETLLEGAGFSLVAKHRRGEGPAHNFVWAKR